MGPRWPRGSGVPGLAPLAALAWLPSCVQSPRVSPVELVASPGLHSVAATLTASSVYCYTLCLHGPPLTPTPPLGAAAELTALTLLVGCTGLRPAGACLAQGGSSCWTRVEVAGLSVTVMVSSQGPVCSGLYAQALPYAPTVGLSLAWHSALSPPYQRGAHSLGSFGSWNLILMMRLQLGAGELEGMMPVYWAAPISHECSLVPPPGPLCVAPSLPSAQASPVPREHLRP